MQFVIEILLDAALAEKRTEAKRQRINPMLDAHVRPPSSCTTLGDGPGEPCPDLGLFLELPPPQSRERVELGAAIILRRLPLRFDPALLLELVQGRVERTVAHLQDLARDLLEPLADRPAVEVAEERGSSKAISPGCLGPGRMDGSSVLLSVTEIRIHPLLSVSKRKEGISVLNFAPRWTAFRDADDVARALRYAGSGQTPIQIRDEQVFTCLDHACSDWCTAGRIRIHCQKYAIIFLT